MPGEAVGVALPPLEHFSIKYTFTFYRASFMCMKISLRMTPNDLKKLQLISVSDPLTHSHSELNLRI